MVLEDLIRIQIQMHQWKEPQLVLVLQFKNFLRNVNEG